MAGSTLVAIAGTCSTTKTAAGKSDGSSAQIARNASTPPADAPTTTMSCPVVCSSGATLLRYPAPRSMIAPLSGPSLIVAALGDSITEGSPGLRGWDVWAALSVRAMVRRGQELGLRVLLADVLPWNNGWPDAEARIRRLNGLVTAIAHDEGVPLLPFHDTLEDPDRPGRMREEWTFEGDHPNEAGYRRLADVVLHGLQKT